MPTEVLVPIHPAAAHVGFPHYLIKIKISPHRFPIAPHYHLAALTVARPRSPPPGHRSPPPSHPHPHPVVPSLPPSCARPHRCPRERLVSRRQAPPLPDVCHPAPDRLSPPPPLRCSWLGRRGHRRGNLLPRLGRRGGHRGNGYRMTPRSLTSIVGPRRPLPVSFFLCSWVEALRY
jgi:hypothetical protein